MGAKCADTVCVGRGLLGVCIVEFAIRIKFLPVRQLGDGLSVGDGGASLLDASGDNCLKVSVGMLGGLP